MSWGKPVHIGDEAQRFRARLLPNKNDGDGGPRMCLMPFLVKDRRTSQMRLTATKPASNGREVDWDMCELSGWLKSPRTDRGSLYMPRD